jgi:hypothetical protein
MTKAEKEKAKKQQMKLEAMKAAGLLPVSAGAEENKACAVLLASGGAGMEKRKGGAVRAEGRQTQILEKH